MARGMTRKYTVNVAGKWILANGRIQYPTGSLHWWTKDGRGGVARKGMWK